MSKLIYGMIMSLDGYTEDEQGKFGWGAPEDEGVHSYINELASSVGTYLYGRRMYDTMVYWETAPLDPDQRQVELDWARQWQAAAKIVYSRTLTEPRSERTRIERTSTRRRCAGSRRTPRTTSPWTDRSSPRTRSARDSSTNSRYRLP